MKIKILTLVSAVCALSAGLWPAYAAESGEDILYSESFRGTGKVNAALIVDQMDWFGSAEYLKSGVPTEINRITSTALDRMLDISDEGMVVTNSTGDYKAWLCKWNNNKYLSSHLSNNYYAEMKIAVSDYISDFDGKDRFSGMFEFAQENDSLIQFSVEEDGVRYLSESGWENSGFEPGNDEHTYRLEVSDGVGTMYIDGEEEFSYTLPVSDEYVRMRFGCGSAGEFDQGACRIADLKFANLYENNFTKDTLENLDVVSDSENINLISTNERYGTKNGISFNKAGWIEYDLTEDYGIKGLTLNFASASSAYEDIKITAWDIFNNEIEVSPDVFDIADFSGTLSKEFQGVVRRTLLPGEEFEKFAAENFSIYKIRIEYTGNTDGALVLLNSIIEYTDAQYPSYLGMTSGGKAVAADGKISAAGKTVELEFSCDARIINNKPGDITLYCAGEEIVPSIEKEGNKMYIKPEDGFSYGKDYDIRLSESLVNSGIRDLPSSISFSTYAADYEVINPVFNQGSCTFTIKSNYIKDESAAVIIVSYKDGKVLDMKASEAKLKSGSENQITTESINVTGADEVAVMVWDNLRSRKALVNIIK